MLYNSKKLKMIKIYKNLRLYWAYVEFPQIFRAVCTTITNKDFWKNKIILELRF